LEVIKKIDIFLDKRMSVVHYTFHGERGVSVGCAEAHQAPADPRESKSGGERRESGWTRTSRASGICNCPGGRAREGPFASAARHPARPTARPAIFLLQFARKPLIILDSGKKTEIF
jgi:hypothetical protein